MGCICSYNKKKGRVLDVSTLPETDFAFEPKDDEFVELNKLDRILHLRRFSMKVGKKYGSSSKGQLNRFPNVLPYDYNRVKLIHPIDGRDYINASWITGDGTCDFRNTSNEKVSISKPTLISFVASQGPLKHTCVHHLQMVIDYSIDVVVVLTSLGYGHGSNYKESCHQYWPNQNFATRTFNHICITELREDHIREDTF